MNFSRLSLLGIVLLTIPLAISVKAGMSAYARATDWRAARHFVQIQAEVVEVHEVRGGIKLWPDRAGGRAHVVEAGFSYQYEGRAYRSDLVAFAGRWRTDRFERATYATLRDHYRNDKPITLWVDPSHPEFAVFDKELSLFPSALLASIAVYFLGMLYPIGVKLTRDDDSPLPIAGGRIVLEPDVNMRMFGATVIAWNTFAWLTVIVGLQEQSWDRLPYWLVLGLPATGLWLAHVWWRLRWREWLRGKPVLALRAARGAGVTHLSGVMHFHSGLGMGACGSRGLHHVKITVRKVVEADTSSGFTSVTLSVPFDGEVSVGTDTIAFRADLPDGQFDPWVDPLCLDLFSFGVQANFVTARRAA